jgi:methionyl-tRNA synthetase
LWPAMLLSAGVKLPNRVFGHGFVYRKNEETGEVQKLSKSLGNAVEPMELVSQFSAEAFRYYFMSQCPFGGDGEFSFERFADVYNAGLANNLGNLYSRAITMAVKYFQGDLGDASSVNATAWRSGLDWDALISELQELIGTFQYNVALTRIWQDVLDSGNRYIQETAPFKLIKTDVETTRVVLVNLADSLRAIAILIKPFLPQTAETFYSAMSYGDFQPWAAVGYGDVRRPLSTKSLRVTAPLIDGKPAPLFPKIQ